MERPRPSTIAWGVLAAGVAAYDLACPKGETLSEGVDGFMESRVGRFATLATIGTFALHLANLIPEGYDPIHAVFAWKENR